MVIAGFLNQQQYHLVLSQRTMGPKNCKVGHLASVRPYCAPRVDQLPKIGDKLIRKSLARAYNPGHYWVDEFIPYVVWKTMGVLTLASHILVQLQFVSDRGFCLSELASEDFHR